MSHSRREAPRVPGSHRRCRPQHRLRCPSPRPPRATRIVWRRQRPLAPACTALLQVRRGPQSCHSQGGVPPPLTATAHVLMPCLQAGALWPRPWASPPSGGSRRCCGRMPLCHLAWSAAAARRLRGLPPPRAGSARRVAGEQRALGRLCRRHHRSRHPRVLAASSHGDITPRRNAPSTTPPQIPSRLPHGLTPTCPPPKQTLTSRPGGGSPCPSARGRLLFRPSTLRVAAPHG
mmetsp:Transcript_21979/g.46737  ORF Transcript_21979/g.46737 Transcript_21979/m.46737 type:complete len:233 (+) Transcript_21979:209-907(+)